MQGKDSGFLLASVLCAIPVMLRFLYIKSECIFFTWFSREPALVGGWTGGSPEAPSDPYGSVLLYLFY